MRASKKRSTRSTWSSKSRKPRRRNPDVGGTWSIMHAGTGMDITPPLQNPRKRGSKKRRGAASKRRNPAYRASFSATGDPKTVRKALKAAGYTEIRLRGAQKGPKRPPGPYAIFVKKHMSGLMARGMSAPEAMREIASMWRAKKAQRENPRGSRRR